MARIWKEERGSQTIEFLTLFPFILFSFLLVWQAGLAAYTVVVSETAARDGARIAAVDKGNAYEEAIRKAAAGLDIVKIKREYTHSGSNPFPDDVKVSVTVKLLAVHFPIIDHVVSLEYTASATMPFEAGGSP